MWYGKDTSASCLVFGEGNMGMGFIQAERKMMSGTARFIGVRD